MEVVVCIQNANSHKMIARQVSVARTLGWIGQTLSEEACVTPLIAECILRSEQSGTNTKKIVNFEGFLGVVVSPRNTIAHTVSLTESISYWYFKGKLRENRSREADQAIPLNCKPTLSVLEKQNLTVQTSTQKLRLPFPAYAVNSFSSSMSTASLATTGPCYTWTQEQFIWHRAFMKASWECRGEHPLECKNCTKLFQKFAPLPSVSLSLSGTSSNETDATTALLSLNTSKARSRRGQKRLYPHPPRQRIPQAQHCMKWHKVQSEKLESKVLAKT